MTLKTRKGNNAMKQEWIRAASLAVALIVGFLVVNQSAYAQTEKPKIIHDAEYYILDAQHGQKWAVEDKDLDAKLAELRKKFGTPPNIIHIMWDDTPVGEIGIPALQRVRGFETPNINRMAAEGIKGIGFLNHLFYERSHIAGPGEVSIAFPLDEKRDVVPGGSGGERSVGRKVFQFAPLARTQSERHRRLALAGGFRLLRSFGLDRLDAPGHTAGRGSAGPDG
jgi:hypothetical protein